MFIFLNLCLYREERKTTMNYKRHLKAQEKKKKAKKQKPRGKYFSTLNKQTLTDLSQL